MNVSPSSSPGKRSTPNNSPEKEQVNHTGLTDVFKRVKIERPLRTASAGRALDFSNPNISDSPPAQYLSLRLQTIKYCVAGILITDISASLKGKIVDAVAALGRSIDITAPLDERIKTYPERAPDTANGCYFIKDRKGENALVVKPACQEKGNNFCPVPSTDRFDGIAPGQGVFREWLAWKIQNLLGVDFGIPETTLLEMTHPLFVDQKTYPVFAALAELNSHVITRKSPEWTVVDFLKCLLKAQGQLPALTQLVLDRDREGLKRFHLGSDFVEFCQNNELPKSLKEVEKMLNHPNWRSMYPIWETLHKQKGMEEAVKKLYQELVEKQHSLQSTLVSAQEFHHGFDCFEDVERTDRIPADQFWKLAIDLILFNCDSHLANILVKGEDLLLIDHGFSLPNPLFAEDGKGLKLPKFEYLDYPQANTRIEGPIKDALLKLDIDEFVTHLKKEIKEVQAHYPKYKNELKMTQDHYTFLTFALRFLQMGIIKERTLKEIAMDYVEGRAQAILAASLTPDHRLDHTILENLL